MSPYAALCSDSSGEQWEDLNWADPLYQEKTAWGDRADQRSGEDWSESSRKTHGAAGAGDRWSGEERRRSGSTFTQTRTF